MHISHVLAVVPVTDHDAATEWYEKLLGRPADNRPMPSLADWHVTDSGWLQVFHDPARAGRSAVNLAVDSVDDARETLRQRGLAPGEPSGASAGVRLLGIDDPDGNTVTLIENLR
jgi:glyoxylase I family protein